MYFDAALQRNGSVLITFATASEVQNAGFEIQRKGLNGSFKKIHFIKGKGYSNNINTYSYEDKSLKSGDTYFYQLIQHDNNSTKKSLGIKSVIVLVKEVVLSEIYFDPIHKTARISVDSIQNATLKLSIYNLMGSLVANQSYLIKAGVQAIEIPISDLPNGIYNCKIILNSTEFVRKLSIN